MPSFFSATSSKAPIPLLIVLLHNQIASLNNNKIASLNSNKIALLQLLALRASRHLLLHLRLLFPTTSCAPYATR